MKSFAGFRDLGPYSPFGASWLEVNEADGEKVRTKTTVGLFFERIPGLIVGMQMI